MKEQDKILKKINEMTKKKEELWLSRIIPFDRGKKERWIISVVNKKKKKVTEKDILKSLNAITEVNKNSEYWICEKIKNGKWVCTFYPKGKRKSWRF